MENISGSGRDILDLLESYKYMNESLFWDDVDSEGRFDYAYGWVKLNLPEEEWRVRSTVPFPKNQAYGSDK